LAVEMHTSGGGTALVALRDAAVRHGLRLEGVRLTTKGLAKQRLPLIALIAPGHYVLVEAVTPSPSHPLPHGPIGTPSSVSVWDPDAKGPGVAGRRGFTVAEWEKAWSGAALRVAGG
jgi:ABC-type bacteriocin/lantibiotic exporter with double-glycine peptidase domain